MNETNLDIEKLQETLADQGFMKLAEDVSTIASDPLVETSLLSEVERPMDSMLRINESAEGKLPEIDRSYEQEILGDLKELAEAEEKVAAHKERIKKFIEDNGVGSFTGSYLGFKYNSATTTTTIDTTKLKAELPDVAAKYSKVGTRASSLSIKEL